MRPAHATQKASLSQELEAWLAGSEERTLGGFVDSFGHKSFALLLVVLLGVAALPVPTAGAGHVCAFLAVLLGLQLIAGREQVWLPSSWRRRELAALRHQRFTAALLGLIRRLERRARPRFGFLFGRRLSDVVFGLLVIGGSAAAFVAPPFTGLDTLPSLGVLIVSLGVLFEDPGIVSAGAAIGIIGVAVEFLLGAVAVHSLATLV